MFYYNFVCLTLSFFLQAEDGIRDGHVTGVQTCALPISARAVSSLVAVARTRFTSQAEVSALLAHLQRQADQPGADATHLVAEIIPQVSEIAQGLWLTYQPILSEVVASFTPDETGETTTREDA